MKTFKIVRGMRDFLPEEAEMMRFVEGEARKVAWLYGYKEVITPVVESYELLAAKSGEELRSRMYVFKDLGGRKVALRPEFTASVARLVATAMRNDPKPLRLFCIGSLYRYDEPQKGRFREFWQSNFELMGSEKPEADVEILLLTNSLMRAAGLRNYTFKIGHIGVLRGILNREGLEEETQNRAMQLMDKKEYKEAISVVENAGASDKCLDVLRKLVKIRGNNFYDVLGEIKKLVKEYEEASQAVDRFAEVLRLVSEAQKLNIMVDAGFARGLEYYTGIIFEVNVPELDIALAGGGRYDKLVELFGGEPTPAVGVAHGIDRIMLAMQEQKAAVKESGEEKRVMIIPAGEALKKEALKTSELLRADGIPVEVEVMGRKIAKALEDADRRKIPYVVIIGEKELKEGAVSLRYMQKREQTIVKIEDLVKTIKSA
ncbi:MAG: histidine--tRNA ligase [Nitrososphaerota archaeon]|nr:histidine--tRNA ligase [Candidatus Bathyarchaeota archaeon]MDW8023949.1 histidine--tRNA ligase [Nitrososphaerota archaeon]